MLAALILTAAVVVATPAPGMVVVGSARFTPSAGRPPAAAVRVKRFLLDVDLVTRADFAAFLRERPQWRPDRAPALFVDERYLSDWRGPTAPGDDVDARAPVTLVSWFAARAYCAAHGKRLPTTNEWELAAAASTTKRDARTDQAFVDVVLRWYARPAPTKLPAVGGAAKNAWGLRDTHGLVWEWVDDFAAGAGGALVDDDDDAFCGAGSAAVDPADYAGFMRLAFRSSLDARFALPLLGFRCARDVP